MEITNHTATRAIGVISQARRAALTPILERRLQQYDIRSDWPESSAPGTDEPRLTRIIAAANRGALKFRKQMSPAMAADDRQASVAITKSPLARLTMTP